MKPAVNFDAFGAWMRGPWYFMELGLQFMQSWQDTWMTHLRLKPEPMKAGVTPSVLRAPVPEPASPERRVLEAEVARAQGRDVPFLGCLQGVQVVGGAEVVPAPITSPVRAEVASTARATPRKPAATAKTVASPAAKVVAKAKTASKTATKPVTKPVAPAVKAAAKPGARSTAKAFPFEPPPSAVAPVKASGATAVPVAPLAEGATALPSVTSTLAMQARSLANAVQPKRAPRAAASKKA